MHCPTPTPLPIRGSERESAHTVDSINVHLKGLQLSGLDMERPCSVNASGLDGWPGEEFPALNGRSSTVLFPETDLDTGVDHVWASHRVFH